MGVRNEEHIFFDGGFRSNTPLREVIQSHRDYWYKTRKHTKEENQDKDNDNENSCTLIWKYISLICGPLRPRKIQFPFDDDFVEDRKWDLIFGDKTDYDEQVANVVTDYVDLLNN